MKLLLDQNLPDRLLRVLQPRFPGSAHVQPLGLANADDRSVWQYARDNGFAIVTKDADFYELSLLRGRPPKVIWLRCGNSTNRFVEALLVSEIGAIGEFLGSADESVCLAIG